MNHAARSLPRLVILACLLQSLGCGGFDRGSGAPAQPAGEAPGAGAGNSESDVVWSRSSYRRDGVPLAADGLESALHGQISAPPDRALIRVSARAKGTDRASASAAASTLSTALVGELEEDGTCTAELLDRSAVRFHGRQDWRVQVSLRVDALLAGLTTVNSRAERLEHCLGRIDAAANSREQGVVRMGAPLLTVDHPEAHRAELLAKAFEDLRGAAEPSDIPAQYQPDATRCTSAGHVSIKDRSLAGIALTVDFICQPAFGRPAPAPAREVESGGTL